MKPRYEWVLHNPGAQEIPYEGVPHAVSFVLAPVEEWPDRLRIELTAEMCHRDLIGCGLGWQEFVDSVSLIRQLATLAARGAPPDEPVSDRFQDEYPTLFANPDLIRRAVDWIWTAFELRLANRTAHTRMAAGGDELTELCNSLVARFDVLPRSAESLTQAHRALSPALTELSHVSLETITRYTSHELFPVTERGDWNGWEEPAWFRFLDAIDRARTYYPGIRRDFDSEIVKQEYDIVEMIVGGDLEEMLAELEQETASVVPTHIGGYHAPEYAERLINAFDKDPERFIRRRSFKALRDAADLSERQERTVKQQLGYQPTAEFSGFLELLYRSAGRQVPKTRLEAKSAVGPQDKRGI